MIDALLDQMLRTSLWGVLDLCLLKKKFEIIDLVIELREEEYFKPYGFTVTLIDGGNFVQKIPFFENNDEFIKENNLYFLGEKSYPSYLAFMNKSVERHKSL